MNRRPTISDAPAVRSRRVLAPARDAGEPAEVLELADAWLSTTLLPCRSDARLPPICLAYT